MTLLNTYIDYSSTILISGLAPEFKYPVPVLECVAAYKYLVNTLQVQRFMCLTYRQLLIFFLFFVRRFLVQKLFFRVILLAAHSVWRHLSVFMHLIYSQISMPHVLILTWNSRPACYLCHL